MVDNIIGKRLYKLRKRKGYTQEYVGNHIFVGRTTISNWELGARRPGYEELIALAKLFEVSVEYFLIENCNKRGGVWVR